MNYLSEYLIPSVACISLLYAVYLGFLRQETFFTLNRYYLAGSIIFSLVFPFLRTAAEYATSGPAVVMVLQPVTVTPEVIEKAIPAGSALFSALVVIYLAGVLIFSVNFLLRITRILVFIRNAGKWGKGMRILSEGLDHEAFSFFRMIFIPSSLKESKNFRQVLQHEEVHARQLHSFDVLLTELLLVIQWFNPVVWLLRRSVKVTHEYIADRGVIENDSDCSSYCALLLGSTGGRGNSMTNNFNYSLLKNRIVMITKERSGTFAGFKTMLAIPVVFGLFQVFPSGFSSGMASEKPRVGPDPQVAALSAGSRQDTVTKGPKTKGFEKLKKMPEFPGGVEAMVKYLSSAIRYPEKAKKEGITGKVLVSFTIDNNGKIQNVKIKQSDNAVFNEEAVRVVSSMPDWKPGINSKDQPVDVGYVLPVKFELDKGGKK